MQAEYERTTARRTPGPPGLRDLLRQLPELRDPEGPTKAVLALSAGFTGLYGPMKRLDRWGPGGMALGQAFAFFALWRLGRSLFFGAAKDRQVHGTEAYGHAFFHLVLPVAGGFAALMTHIATVPPGRRLPRIPSLALAFYLLATGLALAVRAVAVLGIDATMMVHTWVPRDGRQQRSAAYQHLRHPFYGGLARVALGIALTRRSLTAALLALGFSGWLTVWSGMEERELVERFGAAYEEYRLGVPALMPRSPRAEWEMLKTLAQR